MEMHIWQMKKYENKVRKTTCKNLMIICNWGQKPTVQSDLKLLKVSDRQPISGQVVFTLRKGPMKKQNLLFNRKQAPKWRAEEN